MSDQNMHPVLAAAADAAFEANRRAIRENTREQLAVTAKVGADGTATMLIDVIVEEAIIKALKPFNVNILSEEIGWIDNGSAETIIIDPVDGSANAAAGLPFAAFSAVIATDTDFTHAMTSWLHTDERWWGRSDTDKYRTSGQTQLSDAAVSLLRPHDQNRMAWNNVATASSRVRVIGCSTLDGVFVATGRVDAFADVASDTHRLMDIAAAQVMVPAAGGAIRDLYGRPIELDTDLSKRWSGVMAATPQLLDELCEVILS